MDETLLAVSKDGVGAMLFLVGIIGLLMVGISIGIRNRVDELEPRTQAIVFWLLAIGVVAIVGAILAAIADV